MLPAEHRLHRSADFTDVVRRGRRASRPTLTVHLLAADTADSATASGELAAPVRAGLVVSKAVGNAVVRHRTSRRLRHVLAAQLEAPALTAGARLVVRAAPRAATVDSATLARDLASALTSAAAPSSSGAPRTAARS